MKGPRDTDFAYQAVYRYLTNLINEPGSDMQARLPSLRQLAHRLSVSISTIQYACRLPPVNDYVINIIFRKTPIFTDWNKQFLPQ